MGHAVGYACVAPNWRWFLEDVPIAGFLIIESPEGTGRYFWYQGGTEMGLLTWMIIAVVVAVVAGLLGFTGIAAGAATIAKVLFWIFVVVALILLVLTLL